MSIVITFVGRLSSLSPSLSQGSNLSMVIVLPNAKEGLTAVESELHTIDFAEHFRASNYPEMEVFLPKFKLEYSTDLKKSLQRVR